MDDQARQKIENATPETILAELKKQGITNLDDLVRAALESLQGMDLAKESAGAVVGPWFVVAGHSKS